MHRAEVLAAKVPSVDVVVVEAPLPTLAPETA
jgi:hypothetical protein